MIAMSDAIILLVSASLLGSGVYRWQSSLEQNQATTPIAGQILPANAQPEQVQNRVANAESPALNDETSIQSQSQGRFIGKPTAAPLTPSDQSGAQIAGQAEPLTTPGSNLAGESSQAPATAAPQVAEAALYGIHVVRSGDTLSMLSERYGTTVSALQSINSINGTLINVGQELRYPLPAN